MAAVRGSSRSASESAPSRSHGRATTVGMALLVVSAVFFGGSFTHEWLLSRQIEASAAQLQQRIDQINAQNQQMQSQLAYYGSKAYIVPEARAILGLAQPGDTLMHVQFLPPHINIVRVPVRAPVPHESLFVRLLRAIFQ